MNDRPIYETAENVGSELAIAEKICKAWSCEVRKLPRAYNLDYAIVRDGEIAAWAEIKRRHYPRDHFDTIMLSMHKVFAANNFTAVTGQRCFFIVQFNDCLAYADIVGSGRAIQFRGRTDRADWQDVEPCLMIPTSDFKIIKTTAEAA